MIFNSDLPKVIQGIEVSEVKSAATLAYAKFVESEGGERNAALLTLSSILRFSWYELSDYSIPNVREKNPLHDDQNLGQDLREVIHNSGVYFFGPMFKGSQEFAPLRDYEEMLGALLSEGFFVEPLRELSPTQLDMFFTRVLESGLVKNPGDHVPE